MAGAAVGALIGYAGKCSGGTCPLTCNPVGGMIVGAVIGAALASAVGGGAGRAFRPSVHVHEVESATAFADALKGAPVVLVDFYADWRGPCKRLKPVIHELADEYAGRVTVLAVNTDQQGELARQYAVSGIPDVRVLKGGVVVRALVGARAKKAYRAALDAAL